jgi:GntR family transcriptional regulator/MocR family aminotransferase
MDSSPDWYDGESQYWNFDRATLRRAAPTDELLRAAFADAQAMADLPRYRILYEAVRRAILSQQLVPGARLPSTRELARDLALSRNTVLSTFEALLAEGYIVARAGSGTFVAHAAAAPRSRARRPAELARAASTPARAEPEQLSKRGLRLARFQGGRRLEIQPLCGAEADFTLFPMKQWQRLQSRQLRQGHLELLDYATKGGFAPLRRAIADYLRTSRAVRVEVEQVVLTAGTQHSLDLCAQLLADVGDAVWIEDPGYWGARCIFEACDLKIEPVGVDAEGMNPALAPRGSRPRLIYLTPSNQYPLGVAMSLARRRALLQIATRERAWVIEDDYDSELRYSGRPLASLQGLDAEQRVVYVGTFSKVLYPGIKIGYMVVPPALAESFRSALYDLQRPGQLTVQAALADFIERGYFVTHIRRLRQAYAERREQLVGVLSSQLGKAALITSQSAGLHLVLRLPDDVDDLRLEGLAAAHGTTVRALSQYFIGPATARGLVIGFGYVPPDKLAHHGRLLGQTVRAALRR